MWLRQRIVALIKVVCHVYSFNDVNHKLHKTLVTIICDIFYVYCQQNYPIDYRYCQCQTYTTVVVWKRKLTVCVHCSSWCNSCCCQLFIVQRNAGDTRSKKLYQKLMQVVRLVTETCTCVSQSGTSLFLVQVSCTQQNTVLFHHRNCPARDTNRAT